MSGESHATTFDIEREVPAQFMQSIGSIPT
jgi:hypothetical protein